MSKKILSSYDVKYIFTGNIVKKYIYSNPYNPAPMHNPFTTPSDKNDVNKKTIELCSKDVHAYDEKLGCLKLGYMTDDECALFGLETWSETNSRKDILRKREFACRRAKNKVTDLINSNKNLRTFITLTYKENMQDIESAYTDFDIFRRLLKKDFPLFQYVSVIEFQKRGAIHFHILSNVTVPFVPSKGKFKSNLQKEYEVKFSNKYWKNGFVDVRPLKTKQGTDIRNVGKYMSKYMTKSTEIERLAGNKSYSLSRGLIQPTVVTCYHKNDLGKDIVADMNIDYVSQYEAKFLGIIYYIEYSCDKWNYNDCDLPPLIL